VIGSGPGGYSAAIRAGQYGLKTALIEKQPKLGGTCLLVGCIPTKALLHTADVWEHFEHSEADGIHCENPRLDYPKVKDRKDGIVNKHSKGVEFLLKRAKVERIAGFATLKGGGKVEVKSDSGVKTLEARNIIVATGSEARMIPGLQPDPDFILTNIEILNLTAVPKSLAVIGAGAVGVEFASIFKRFGTDVTVIEMLPRMVPVEDEDISKELERQFKKQKIRVETGAKASDIQKTDKGVKLTLTTKEGKQEQLETEKLLVAVGRKPNTENIGLENTKVETDRGFIKVDQNQQTAEPGVYAIGDVINTPQLAHVGYAEAVLVIKDILGEHPIPVAYDRVPWAIYCSPEVAFVGPSEEAARESGLDVVVAKHQFRANSRAQILGELDGLVKVIAKRQADGTAGQIIGVHMVGPWVTEQLSGGYLAVNWEATVAETAAFIQPHPSLTELFGETVLSLTGRSLNV
jgi:dihydrolipoamide dehydrogenase